jgi:prevent-host-death family protein
MAKKIINVNELQSQISSVLKDVQNGDVYEVMRYSEPVAVVLGYKDYLNVRGECHKCVQDLRRLVKEDVPVDLGANQ